MQSLLQNNYFLSLLLACCWGPSFMFIKIALSSFSPLMTVEIRLLIASFILFVYVKLSKIPFPTSFRMWLHCFVMGVFAAAFPFSLFCIAEIYIESAQAGIINGLTPIFTVILAHFLLKSELITFDRFLGVLAGLIGFCCLLLPTLIDLSFALDSLSMFLVAMAALSYAIGMVYGKTYMPAKINLAIPCSQIICSSVVLLPFALYFQPAITHFPIHLSAIFAVICLAILGTVFAFIVYYRILQFGGAVVLSMAIYLLPLFSILLGVIFLHETIHFSTLIGTGMIILGMAFANGAIKPSQIFLKRVEVSKSPDMQGRRTYD